VRVRVRARLAGRCRALACAAHRSSPNPKNVSRAPRPTKNSNSKSNREEDEELRELRSSLARLVAHRREAARQAEGAALVALQGALDDAARETAGALAREAKAADAAARRKFDAAAAGLEGRASEIARLQERFEAEMAAAWRAYVGAHGAVEAAARARLCFHRFLLLCWGAAAAGAACRLPPLPAASHAHSPPLAPSSAPKPKHLKHAGRRGAGPEARGLGAAPPRSAEGAQRRAARRNRAQAVGAARLGAPPARPGQAAAQPNVRMAGRRRAPPLQPS